MATIAYVDKSATSTTAKVNYSTDLTPPNSDSENSYGTPSYSWSGDFNASTKSGQASITLTAGESKNVTASVTVTASYSYRYWIDTIPAVPPDKDDEGNDIPGTGKDEIPGHWSPWYSGTPWTDTETATLNKPIYAHPAKFSGFTFGLTLIDFLKATEWTEFEQKVKQYDTWNNQAPSSYNPKIVNKGDKITAQLFKDVADKLGGGAIVITPNVTPIDKKLFQDLVTALNRGV